MLSKKNKEEDDDLSIKLKIDHKLYNDLNTNRKI